MLAAPAGGWLSVAPSTKVEDLLASTLAKLVANDEALLDELWAADGSPVRAAAASRVTYMRSCKFR